MPKPTLAALPGLAAGAGLTLVLACDLCISERLSLDTGVLPVSEGNTQASSLVSASGITQNRP